MMAMDWARPKITIGRLTQILTLQSTPSRIRTYDRGIRNPVLYPTELSGRALHLSDNSEMMPSAIVSQHL